MSSSILTTCGNPEDLSTANEASVLIPEMDLGSRGWFLGLEDIGQSGCQDPQTVPISCSLGKALVLPKPLHLDWTSCDATFQ